MGACEENERVSLPTTRNLCFHLAPLAEPIYLYSTTDHVLNSIYHLTPSHMVFCLSVSSPISGSSCSHTSDPSTTV
jgi:hypothetical protein